MKTKEFKVWDYNEKKFQYFELHNITVPDRLLCQWKYPVQQFIGLLDKNMKQIYEGDVVKGIYGSEGLEIIGEVKYSNDLCAYVVDWNHLFADISFDSLEVVGNMVKDYMYNEKGELVKKT